MTKTTFTLTLDPDEAATVLRLAFGVIADMSPVCPVPTDRDDPCSPRRSATCATSSTTGSTTAP